MKQKVTKELSAAATGIIPAETKVSSAKDGVKKQVKSIKIEIDSELDLIKLSYKLYFLDNKGKALDVEPKSKVVYIRDTAETGYAEMDEEGLNIDMDTYEMETPEKLTITDWNKQLGDIVIGSAISYLEGYEGIE